MNCYINGGLSERKVLIFMNVALFSGTSGARLPVAYDGKQGASGAEGRVFPVPGTAQVAKVFFSALAGAKSSTKKGILYSSNKRRSSG